ncbi:MAG: cupin domain-containing protein [Candidatus Bathyarchaeota archaeon]|nr:cupin domain-containing protein [Candidatus Bathyarchaeota archaeon]
MQDTTWEKAPSLEPVPGVKISIIGNGMHASQCYIVIGPGAVVDWHAHPQEQMGTLISGAGELSTRERTVKAKPGAAWFLSPNEEHKFVTTGDEPAIIIETFAPARVDYVIKAK